MFWEEPGVDVVKATTVSQLVVHVFEILHSPRVHILQLCYFQLKLGVGLVLGIDIVENVFLNEGQIVFYGLFLGCN